MTTQVKATLGRAMTVYWKPDGDLAVVAISWVLVVGAFYTASVIVGQNVWGGIAYFILYAVLGASLFGIGIPLYWMIVVRKRSLADLGLSTRWLGVSLVLQFSFAALQYLATLAQVRLPPLEEFAPLVALALCIGFFEAVFWRGWVLLRLEEAFGILPAILLSSALYAAYHVGYGMPTSEMVFLFFVGIMFAVVFRLTKNVLILWPVFQPMGQLVTLVKDGLALPFLSTLGFAEALILMLVLVGLAARYQRTRHQRDNMPTPIDTTMLK